MVNELVENGAHSCGTDVEFMRGLACFTLEEFLRLVIDRNGVLVLP